MKEEHVSSFLASKCDVTKVMESKINKMTETYQCSVDALQLEAAASSKATALEKFLRAASLEAKNFVCDIQNSLDEQRQVLDFSAKQQEEGLRRSQLISEATVNLFDDLHQRASQAMTFVEKRRIDKVGQLQKFEKAFKEEALREEKLALEEITAILTTLTTKKAAMVSEASRNLQDCCANEYKQLLQELSGVQQITSSAKKKVNGYADEVKQNFWEDTFTYTQSNVTLENCIQECTNKSDNMNQQLGQTHLLLTNNLAELENISRESSDRIDESLSACSDRIVFDLDGRFVPRNNIIYSFLLCIVVQIYNMLL